MIAELGAQYVVGFSPSSGAPGRNHKTRGSPEAGLKVRYRERYGQ
jgi:hypothetical protein